MPGDGIGRLTQLKNTDPKRGHFFNLRKTIPKRAQRIARRQNTVDGRHAAPVEVGSLLSH